MDILPPDWVPATFPLRSALFLDIRHELLAYNPAHGAIKGPGTSCLLRIKPSKKQAREFNLLGSFSPYEKNIRKWHYVYDCGKAQRLYLLGENLLEAIVAVMVLVLGKGAGKVVGDYVDWVEVYCRGADAVLDGVRLWGGNMAEGGLWGWCEGCRGEDATEGGEFDGGGGDQGGAGGSGGGAEKEKPQKSAAAKQNQTKDTTQQTHRVALPLSPRSTIACSVTTNAPYVHPRGQEGPGSYDFNFQFSHEHGLQPQVPLLPTYCSTYRDRPIGGPTNFDQAFNTTYSCIGDQLNSYTEARYTAGFTTGNYEGQAAGFEKGFDQGRQYGVDDGHVDGFDAGYSLGYEEGQETGYAMGKGDGYKEGYKEGWGNGKKQIRAVWYVLRRLQTRG